MSAVQNPPVASGAIVRQQGLLEALKACLTELEELNKSVGWRDGEWPAVSGAKAAIVAHEAIPASSELKGHRAFGIFRQRAEENHGKDFFYTAMWHGDTRVSEGERLVPGWFVPEAQLIGDEALIDADVFEVYWRAPAGSSVRTTLEAARDADLSQYDDTATGLARRAIASKAWNNAIAASQPHE